MTRIVAAIVSVVCFATAEVLTLAFTGVSEGWTLLAAFFGLIMLIAFLNNAKPRALGAALACGAVPPSLVVANTVALPLRVVLPAVLLLVSAEMATLASQQISIVSDVRNDGRAAALDIARLAGLAAVAATVVGLAGRVRIGSGLAPLAIGATAALGLLYIIAAEP
jgi:4-hydroxybenzoate polyprenyltransferase